MQPQLLSLSYYLHLSILTAEYSCNCDLYISELSSQQDSIQNEKPDMSTLFEASLNWWQFAISEWIPQSSLKHVITTMACLNFRALTMRKNLPKTLDQLIFCKYTLAFCKCSQIY